MNSLDATETLTQIQNLDPASKLEIQKVIEQESQKAELQKSSPPCKPRDTNGRHPQARGYVDPRITKVTIGALRNVLAKWAGVNLRGARRLVCRIVWIGSLIRIFLLFSGMESFVLKGVDE